MRDANRDLEAKPEFSLGGVDGTPRVDFYGLRRRETLYDAERRLRRLTGEPDASLELAAKQLWGRTFMDIGLSTRPHVKLHGVIKSASGSFVGTGDRELTVEQLNGARSFGNRLRLSDDSEVDGVLFTREFLRDETLKDRDILRVALSRAGLLQYCLRPIDGRNPSAIDPPIQVFDFQLLPVDRVPALKVLVSLVKEERPQYSADRIRKVLMFYGLWQPIRAVGDRQAAH